MTLPPGGTSCACVAGGTDSSSVSVGVAVADGSVGSSETWGVEIVSSSVVGAVEEAEGSGSPCCLHPQMDTAIPMHKIAAIHFFILCYPLFFVIL